MVKEATPKVTTWMCDNGHHGSHVRRSVQVAGWPRMYSGKCAGTVFSAATGNEELCGCDCHDKQYSFKEHLRVFYPEEYARRFNAQPH